MSTPLYPYQLDTVPFGCYCNRGFVQDCASRPEQTLQARQQFIGDWRGAVAQPRSVHVHHVAQHFALRYGWPVQQRVEQLLGRQSPQLLPYLETLGCAPLPPATAAAPPAQQGALVYDSLLGRVF